MRMIVSCAVRWDAKQQERASDVIEMQSIAMEPWYLRTNHKRTTNPKDDKFCIPRGQTEERRVPRGDVSRWLRIVCLRFRFVVVWENRIAFVVRWIYDWIGMDGRDDPRHLGDLGSGIVLDKFLPRELVYHSCVRS